MIITIKETVGRPSSSKAAWSNRDKSSKGLTIMCLKGFRLKKSSINLPIIDGSLITNEKYQFKY